LKHSCLVDDYDAQAAALLSLLLGRRPFDPQRWGGVGIVEADLLQRRRSLGYGILDPSAEQCQAFREHLARRGLLERVEEMAQTTFQEYATSVTSTASCRCFRVLCRIERRWLSKTA